MPGRQPPAPPRNTQTEASQYVHDYVDLDLCATSEFCT